MNIYRIAMSHCKKLACLPIIFLESCSVQFTRCCATKMRHDKTHLKNSAGVFIKLFARKPEVI